ncbi:MAG TPA: FHA domain-containing protein [Acidimicrobiia bacterium]|nr:FHA domain-containing protein [Acidimicrobiia bacterium]
MFCNQCGHRNPPGSNFCSSCGAALNMPEIEDTTMSHVVTPAEEREGDDDLKVSPDELTGGVALLVVRKGPNEGSKYMLDAEVTRAGRHPDSDIFLDDITVSRRHAEVIRRADGFHVLDVGSLNGTYVNRDRVEDVKLNNGDELQIGKFKLVFFTGQGN